MKRNGAKVELKTKRSTLMGYLQEVDRWLDMLFTDLADGNISFEDTKRDIRERILESYRNGVAKGQSSVLQMPQRERSRRSRRNG